MSKNTIDYLNLRIQLLKKNIKQRDIAKKAGVHESLVSNILAGRDKSEKVLKIIEEMIRGVS